MQYVTDPVTIVQFNIGKIGRTWLPELGSHRYFVNRFIALINIFSCLFMIFILRYFSIKLQTSLLGQLRAKIALTFSFAL